MQTLQGLAERAALQQCWYERCAQITLNWLLQMMLTRTAVRWTPSGIGDRHWAMHAHLNVYSREMGLSGSVQGAADVERLLRSVLIVMCSTQLPKPLVRGATNCSSACHIGCDLGPSTC